MSMYCQSPTMVPRQINLYWHDMNHIGTILNSCLSSLHQWHPRECWNIHLWTAEHLPENMSIPPNWGMLCHEHRADYVRLWILAHEGGIWSDAYMLHGKPIDRIFNLTLPGIHAFSPPPPYDLVPSDSIENWLLACSPGDAFMQRWFHEFSNRVAISSTSLPYYSMHDISIQLRKEFPAHPIYLLDSCTGPYKSWCQTQREPLLYGLNIAWDLAYGPRTTTKLNKYSRNVAEYWPLIASLYLLLFAFLIFLIN